MSSKKTIIVMTGSTDFGAQSYFYSGSNNQIDTTWIQKEWYSGKYISSVGYTSVGWFIAMSIAPAWQAQNYLFNPYWPTSDIEAYRQKGQFITDCACDGNNWFVVLTSNTGITDQRIIVSVPWDTANAFINQNWHMGYFITSITCVAGLWTVVMSSGTIYRSQYYLWGSTMEEIARKIEEKWMQGFLISSIAYSQADRQYLAVMSEYPGSADAQQSRTLNTHHPDEFIKRNWNTKKITCLA